MRKKLKSIEQIKNDNIHKKVYDDNSITFFDNDGNYKGRINESMMKYFGQEINVEKVKSNLYEWYGEWYWKDDWFELEVELLEDALFEI